MGTRILRGQMQDQEFTTRVQLMPYWATAILALITLNLVWPLHHHLRSISLQCSWVADWQLQAQSNVQVLAYLNAFAEEYDLKRHISFNTLASVVGMQPVSSTKPGDCFALTS